MRFRSFIDSDARRLREFRCATKKDPAHERLISRMLRTELVPVLRDPDRDLRAFVVEDDDGKLLGIAALELSDDNHRWEMMAVGVSVDAKRRASDGRWRGLRSPTRKRLRATR